MNITWRKEELGTLVTFRSGGTPSKTNSAYWGGDFPWITARDLKTFYLENSQERITELGSRNGTRIANEGSLLILVRGMTLKKDVPVCLATRPVAFNQDVKALETRGINPVYLGYFLVSRKSALMRLVSEAGHGTGTLQTDLLASFPILFPSLSEQEAIAGSLRIWDCAVAIIECLIAAKLKLRKGLMQKLLTGKRRFPGFSEPWREMRLGDVFTNRVETNRPDLALVAITRKNGVVDRDSLNRRDSSNEDKSKYLRIAPGDIGYNTMRMWQGVSGLSSIEGIVSPAYTIVTPDDATLVPEFIALLFKSPPMIHWFHRYSQGLVNDTLSLKYQNFAKISALLPERAEQQRIADAFRPLDRELALLDTQLAAIKTQKKGLMQQLLTGKRRVKIAPEAA